jgi:CspA family cold shock protein
MAAPKAAPKAGARVTGVMKWFNDAKGFGFATCDDGQGDVFVHYSEIVAEKGVFKSLAADDKVEFEVVQGVKGLAASKVTKVV